MPFFTNSRAKQHRRVHVELVENLVLPACAGGRVTSVNLYRCSIAQADPEFQKALVASQSATLTSDFAAALGCPRP